MIKAIDELVAAGIVERQRRGKMQANLYRVKSTTFTSQPPSEVKGVDLEPSEVNDVDDTEAVNVQCSKAPLLVKSTTFTSEVNHVDSNENHLTRITEREDVEAVAASSPIVRVPAELDSFDAALRGLPGYSPDEAFFAKVSKYRAMDLEEEAIKIASWLREPKQRQAKRRCSAAFVLNWLKRTNTPPLTTNGHRKPYRSLGNQSGAWAEHPDAPPLNPGFETDAFDAMGQRRAARRI